MPSALGTVLRAGWTAVCLWIALASITGEDGVWWAILFTAIALAPWVWREAS